MYFHLSYISHYRMIKGKRVKGKPIKEQAKATLAYNSSRPGKNNEKLKRTLFTNIGQPTEEEALETIDTAPENTLFWRMRLSPDPKKENKDKVVDLWQLTRE